MIYLFAGSSQIKVSSNNSKNQDTEMKTNTQNPIIRLAILSFLFLSTLSCTRVYLPNAAQTVFYDNEGDASIAAFTGTNGFDGQISYAVTDDWFVGIAGSFMNADSNKEDATDFIRHSYYEGGFGYYSKFGSRGKYNIQGGIGRGNIETISVYSFFGDHAVPGTGVYHKYFLQNTIGFSTSAIDLGGNVRFNYVDFQHLRIYDEIFRHQKDYFIEPTFFLRAGWKNFRYNMQCSLIFGLKRDRPFDYDWLRINMGLSYQFNIFGKSKEEY